MGSRRWQPELLCYTRHRGNIERVDYLRFPHPFLHRLRPSRERRLPRSNGRKYSPHFVGRVVYKYLKSRNSVNTLIALIL